MVRGTSKTWDEEGGWGVVVSPDVPGDVFVSFSVVAGEGYQPLIEGEPVEFDYIHAVPGGEYGCPYVAVTVTRLNP